MARPIRRNPFYLALIGLLLVALIVGVVAAFSHRAPVKVSYRLPYRPEVKIADHSQAWKEIGITKYEGSKTCIRCHEDEVMDVFHSAHYQMGNYVSDVEGGGRVWAGSKVLYNDFCGSIFWNGSVPVNWIGNATLKVPPPGKENLKGKFLASGCSMCHGVSLGKVPSKDATKEQLENIDCLVCHHLEYAGGGYGVKKGYRKLVKTEEGFRYMPNPELNATELASKIVARPTSASCQWCHAYAGGGVNFKRPNLGEIVPQKIDQISEELDVHMARGMQCVDCHVAEDHKFGTTSVDSWHRQSDNVPRCEKCHEVRHTRPVIGWVIETFHRDKVACQTCHIPRFAKTMPTDMVRMWNATEWNEINHKWFAKLEYGTNVTPVYAWWNERTRKAYIYPEKADLKPGNVVIYAAPVGSKDDGKIYPFKYHYAYVPFDSRAGIPVPTKVGAVFTAKRVDKMVELGEKIAGLKADRWIKLERYMAINHGVEPADRALFCFDCHGVWKTRMDWHALGYGDYPKVAFLVTAIILPALLVGGLLYLGRRCAKG